MSMNIQNKEYSEKPKQKLTFRTVLLAALIIGIPTAVGIAHNPQEAYIFVKNLAQGIDLVPESQKGKDATAGFLTEHNEVIKNIAARYGLPSDAVETLALLEIGADDQSGIFGMTKLSEQSVKKMVNSALVKTGYVGKSTKDKTHNIGLSLGMLNIKPGLLTKAVIANIKNDQLKSQLALHYDENSHHVDAKTLDDLINSGGFPIELEIVAANMKLYYPTIHDLATKNNWGHDAEMVVLSMANTNFPYESSPIYSEHPLTKGVPMPDLKDK